MSKYHKSNQRYESSYDATYDTYSGTTIDAVRGICDTCDARPAIHIAQPSHSAKSHQCPSNSQPTVQAPEQGREEYRGRVEDYRGRDDDRRRVDDRERRDLNSQTYDMQRYDPGISYFTSVITPVTGLVSSHTNLVGSVEFKMRRRNKTVTLQWEPFGGAISSNGISYLTVSQSISNTPPYKLSFPILIEYKGVNRMCVISIDPHSKPNHIKIYLHTDTNIADTIAGDSFHVHGSCITWIVD